MGEWTKMVVYTDLVEGEAREQMKREAAESRKIFERDAYYKRFLKGASNEEEVHKREEY